MDNFDTIEKVEKYIKDAKIYGNYNYCFTVQPSDTVKDAILMSLGAVGGAILGAKKSKGIIGYILNKNENGIGIIPIEKDKNVEKVAIEKLIFLKNEDIDKVKVKYDTLGKLIIIKMKDKTKYAFKTASSIKNIDYHKINLDKFIGSYK